MRAPLQRPALAAIVFLILHAWGGWYALVTLRDAWLSRLLLRILAEQALFFRLSHLPWTVVLGGIGLAALLAVVEVCVTLGRWSRGQREPDVGVRLRALAYVSLACIFVNAFFVSTPESFSGPFRVRFPTCAQISVTFAYGGYALWSLLLPRLRRAISDRMRRRLDVLAMNVALLLVLAEVGLRVVAAARPSPLLVTSSSTSQVRRDSERQPPGTLRFGFPMNQGGHYDTEFQPRTATGKRIVVDIGDSFSYGAVPHAYHFTTIAERELPDVEIYNMGYPGLGPSDYLDLLQRQALPLGPDLVVINLFVGNDVADNASSPGPARWYDADRYLLAVVWYRLQIVRRSEIVDAGRTAASGVPQEDPTVAYPWLTDPWLERPSLNSEVYAQVEARNSGGICLPDSGVYEHFFRTLAKIERMAGDIPLAFMLIPDEFQVEDDLWDEIVRSHAQPLDRDLAQRTIVPWLKAHGLPVLDLLPLMRTVEPMKDGRRHLYHLHDMHFNARGNYVAGRALAPFVDSVLRVRLPRRAPSK